MQHQCGGRDRMLGSSKIWSEKLKLSYYKAHRVTEGTEVTQCHGGADGTKSNRDVVYRFLISSEINTLGIESLIKLVNFLRSSTHRRCLRDFHCFVLKILRPLRASVWHFVRDSSYYFKLKAKKQRKDNGLSLIIQVFCKDVSYLIR